MFKTQERLACFRCGRLPQQFVVLGCSHPICMDCYGQIDKSQQIKSGSGCDCDKYSSLRSSAQVFCGASQTLKEYIPNPQSPEINNEEDYIVGGSTTLASGSSRKDCKESPVIRKKNAPKREKPVSNFELNEGKRRLKTEQEYSESGSIGWLNQRHATVQATTVERGEQTMSFTDARDKIFDEQLDFIETQYRQAINEIKQAVEAKLRCFNMYFDSLKENLVQWYIKVDGRERRSVQGINVTRLVRDRYSEFDKQLQAFRNDIFEFELKIDRFFPRDVTQLTAKQTKDESEEEQSESVSSNIYIINRPWITEGCSRLRCLSPHPSQVATQFKAAASKLRKQTLKNMDFIDGLLSRNRLKRWCSGPKIIL